MNENQTISEEKSHFNKKILLLIYLLFMLILNIFDFLNLLQGDIDFIEKLLSWSLFGYLFYQASLTKIFIGKKIPIFDLLYIVAFALMSITKSLIYYTQNGLYVSQKYFIFRWILDLISNVNSSNFVLYTFFIGIIIIVINSIILLKKNPIEENSLLGSINWNKFTKFIKLQYITLILISIFFGVVLFNFFMEWFALAIDDFIPIIGLFYYLFKYIHLHTENKFSSFLENVNDSGQNFFEKIIESFSNKKTLLIGISFILTLHLIVDAGVYIFPYVTGLDNGLYFSSLEQNQHIPIFNFFNIENSRIYQDLGQDFLLNLSLMIIYIITIYTVLSLLILPFYIYYKNIQKEEAKINKTFGTLFLAGLIFLPIIYFLPNINIPIQIDSPPENSNIFGVDIYTTKIITEDLTLNYPYELLAATILFLVTIGFLLFRYEKYKIYFDKIIYIVVIIFFLIYITIFFISVISQEYNYIKKDLESFKTISTVDEYNKIYTLSEDKEIYKLTYTIKDEKTNIETNIVLFTNLSKIKDKNFINYTLGQSHEEYVLVTQNLDVNKKYQINVDLNTIYFQKPQEIKNNILISKENSIQYLYKLEPNNFSFEEKKSGYIITAEKQYGKKITIKDKSYLQSIMININQYLKFIFLSIFYIFGSLEFASYFIRKNILHTT